MVDFGALVPAAAEAAVEADRAAPAAAVCNLAGMAGSLMDPVFCFSDSCRPAGVYSGYT